MNILETLVNVVKDEPLVEVSQEDLRKSQQNFNQTKSDKLVNVDKNEVFQQFKESEGLQTNESILKNINDQKEKKNEIKECTELAHKLKTQIDTNKDKIAKKQSLKNQEEIQQGIIDEEEFEIIKILKDLKKDYKNYTDKIRSLKATVMIIDQNIQQCKRSLLQDFEKWFIKKYGISVHDLNNPDINNQSDEEVQDHHSDQNEIDQDAYAYINAQKHVNKLQKARKTELHKK